MKTLFYTKKGDAGIVHFSGKQIQKSDAIFMLLGSLDECNSWIGLVRASLNEPNSLLKKQLFQLQEMLFIAQAEIAAITFGFGTSGATKPSYPRITKRHITQCEKIIETVDEKLPKLTKFVLPGASVISAQIDIARTVARKAERYAVISRDAYPFSDHLLSFLNRLSSVLFALARGFNHSHGIAELHPTY